MKNVRNDNPDKFYPVKEESGAMFALTNQPIFGEFNRDVERRPSNNSIKSTLRDVVFEIEPDVFAVRRGTELVFVRGEQVCLAEVVDRWIKITREAL